MSSREREREKRERDEGFRWMCVCVVLTQPIKTPKNLHLGSNWFSTNLLQSNSQINPNPNSTNRFPKKIGINLIGPNILLGL